MLRTVLLCALLAIAAAPAAAAPPPLSASAADSMVTDAERAIATGDDALSESTISRIPASSLDAVRLTRVQIVRAQIGLKRNLPEVVLRALPSNSARTPTFAPKIEQLRSQALFAMGDPVGAVRSLVTRERYLTDPSAIAGNRELIWNGLVASPLPSNAAGLIPQQDPMTRGWLELALQLQQNASSAQIADWARRNYAHPAAEKAAHIRVQKTPVPMIAAGPTPAAPPPSYTVQPAPIPGFGPNGPPAGTAPSAWVGVAAPVAPAPPAFGASRGYALLLPLSGSLAPSGRALRDGFVSAWYMDRGAKSPVRVYDAGSSAGQTVAAYQLAVRNGASIVVGPLTKDGLAALAAAGPPPVPVLALNYLDNGAAPANFYQFGLAPEDEARAAAAQALSQDRRKALVLAPATEWGERVVAAFSQAYQAQGGQIVQSARYPSGTQDFSKPLKDLMNLDQSNQRHNALTTVIGEPSEFEPRPRGDADLVFAPARAVEARALLPQLEFFRASEMPIYSVSAAFTGRERDLDGLTVCDMPWMQGNKGAWAEARAQAVDSFGDAMRDQPRLFALGYDALRVAQALERGEFGGGRGIDGATGRLQLAPGGRVQRELDCAGAGDGRIAAASP